MPTPQISPRRGTLRRRRSSGGPFRPNALLDRSQVTDRRLNTPVETRAAWDGRRRVGNPFSVLFPVPPLKRVNPSVRPPARPRSRGGSFGPHSRINTTGLNARGQALFESMRASGSSVTSMAVPRISDIGRLLTGGRKGVPGHVAPVPAPALNSITPNMVNQSDAGQTVRGALRRQMAKRTPRQLAKPTRRRVGGSARSL